MTAEKAVAVRLADSDRNQAVGRLSTALAQGRLDSAEFDARLGMALSARTDSELAPVMADLPDGPDELAERDRQAWLLEWRHWLAGAVLMVGIWATDVGDGFWPAVPLGSWAAVLLAAAVAPPKDPDR